MDFLGSFACSLARTGDADAAAPRRRHRLQRGLSARKIWVAWAPSQWKNMG